jgi:hypothetical protein
MLVVDEVGGAETGKAAAGLSGGVAKGGLVDAVVTIQGSRIGELGELAKSHPVRDLAVKTQQGDEG